jgi:poly(A) polymerase
MCPHFTKRRLALHIVKKLQERGYSAYFAGGCVRDALMERKPQDYDIVTAAKVADIRKIFKRTVSVGAHFGVVLVVENGIPFEVATLRGSEGGKSSCDPYLDALKRDFTINGMLYDPIKRKVLDFVGGREDIHRKIVRVIGEPAQRLKEDRLRLLRAVRLAVNLGFRIERRTSETIRTMSGQLARVSKERIRDELIKIMTGPNPYRGVALMDSLGLLHAVLPEVTRFKGVQQPEEFHPEGDVFTHTLLMLKRLKNASEVLAFSALLHDVGKPDAYRLAERIRFDGHDRIGEILGKDILTRLRFPTKLIKSIVGCVGNHINLLNAPKMKEATLKRLMMKDTFEYELELHRIDSLASHGDLALWKFLKQRYREFGDEPVKPRPLLNGHELMEMGFLQGPVIGRIQKELVDMQLENRITTKAQARSWVRKSFELEQVGVCDTIKSWKS